LKNNYKPYNLKKYLAVALSHLVFGQEVRKHQAMEKEDRVSENERTNNEDLLLYRY
jgi:hypothetical protein